MDFVKKFLIKYRWSMLKWMLKRNELKILETDDENNYLMIEFPGSLLETNECINALLSLHNDSFSIKLETAVIFDNILLNTKTMSNVLDYAYQANCSISGILIQNEEQVKFNISKDFSYLDLAKIKSDSLKFKNCILDIFKYLNSRIESASSTYIDLSMFENVDLAYFDPQFYAEQKEFVYGSWEKYIESLKSGTNQSQMNGITVDKDVIIQEIQMCKAFEEANNMLLSEIGNLVVQEIIWNRQLILDLENDDFTTQ